MYAKKEITINAPLGNVVKLFDQPENMKYWAPVPISVERISGTPGQPGAKSKLKFKRFDLIETITAKDLPRELSGTYEMEAMANSIKHSFASLKENQTIYTVEVDYEFKKAMPKIINAIAPWMFTRPAYKYMKMFKDFVETSATVQRT